MDRRILCLLFTICALSTSKTAQAQSTYESNLFITFAGAAPSRGNADGSGNIARFASPGGVASDSAGNIYAADTGNHTIRRITPKGVVSTLAGLPGLPGISGSSDGTGSAARFNNPHGIAVDSAGNIYVADTGNHTIRRITSAGVVSTLAGSAGNPGSGDGNGGAAQFENPNGVAVDSAGTIYVADTGNHTIRRLTSAGVVSTLAGLAGNAGSADGVGPAARFNSPRGVTVDGAGNVLVADSANSVIRKITSAGVVSTLAGLAGNAGSSDGTGSAARFNIPTSVTLDTAGNVFVADTNNNTIRQITPAAIVSTLAGSAGTVGSADGTGSAARFSSPNSATMDSSGNLYVADTFNNTVRKIRTGAMVITLAGSASDGTGSVDASGNAARFAIPGGVAANAAGNVYVADTGNNTIRMITPAGVVSTLAGLAGNPGSADGTGTAARFWQPAGVAADSAGKVYVADTDNHTIRQITPAGVVSTLAGLAGNLGSANGTGSAARFSYPMDVAVDNAGNVYVADFGNCTIRKITPGGQVTTLAGSAQSCYSADGNGSAARFNLPHGLAVNNTGIVYVADTDGCTIRKITPDGQVSTLAGSVGVTGSTDGMGSGARFTYPGRVAVDGAGTIYVGDFGNNAIRKVTPAGVVTTLGGLPGRYGSADGSGNGALFNGNEGVAVDSAGDIYVADTGNSTIRVGGTTPVQLFSVGSTKVHGGIEPFDINLPVLPITAPRGIECRSGGANGNYMLVFTFTNNLTNVDTATLTAGTGAVSTSGIGPMANQYTVNLTGVANQQYLTVTLNNVQDSQNNIGNVSAPMGVLIGDTNADGFVDAIDTSQTKSQSGNAVTDSNFREDVNVDGFLDAIDTSFVKSESGTSLPQHEQSGLLERLGFFRSRKKEMKEIDH